MRRHLPLLAALLASSCLTAWDVGGPWRCSADQTCAAGYTCDDGVCCRPGASPTCPTLPAPNGSCASGEARVYYEDRDGDGEGNAQVNLVRCRAPLTGRWVLQGGDCDDADPAINTAGVEACDGKDQNCDRAFDDGHPQTAFYRDQDGDGFGDPATTVSACAAPAGYVPQAGDCAPFDPSKFPGAPERCNDLDDDCDGVRDTVEGAFADVDNPGDAVRFPCEHDTARGVCRAGAFRCEVLPAGAGVRRTCLSLAAPSREVCNGLDDDCDGSPDERPECGGPTSLVGPAARAAGVTWRARRLTDASDLNSRCQKNVAGVEQPVTSDGTTWRADTDGYNLWMAEAPPAGWDLSRAGLRLNLDFSATFTPTGDARGAWGDPAGTDAFNPVVYLCGADDGEVIRYRIAQPADTFRLDDSAFSLELPLDPAGSAWIVGRGSGFDTSRVHRVEVLVKSLTPAFTITFSTATGFK